MDFTNYNNSRTISSLKIFKYLIFKYLNIKFEIQNNKLIQCPFKTMTDWKEGKKSLFLVPIAYSISIILSLQYVKVRVCRAQNAIYLQQSWIYFVKFKTIFLVVENLSGDIWKSICTNNRNTIRLTWDWGDRL